MPSNLNRKSLADIEADKQKRRLATTELIRREYETSAKQRFNLATAELPGTQRPQKVFDSVEKTIKDSLKFEGFKPKPVPNFEKSRADVKLNAAMLKREKHLLDKEEKEQAELLHQMELGLKDASEFYRWQREMEQKDDIEKIERIQKMKIEMELAREQAIIAQEKNVQKNHENAIKVKKEIDVLLTERDK